MSYEQNEKIEKLKNYLTANVKKQQKFHDDVQALEADFLWDAGRFWATVVYNAKSLNGYKTLKEFNQFVKQYNKSTNNKINADKLFFSYWLRNVLGFVHIAQAISYTVHRFKELRHLLNELKFVCSFYNENYKGESVKIDKAIFLSSAKSYEDKHAITLNREGIFFNRWAKEEDGKVQLSPMDIYFQPILDNWNELEFLYTWQQHCKRDETKAFFISSKVFGKIHKTFSGFKDLPGIETFEQQKVILIVDKGYSLNFYETEFHYWTALEDKIGGYLWELLTDDKKYSDDKERLIIWLAKMLSDNLYPNHLKYVTAESKRRFLDAAFELLETEKDVVGCENEIAKIKLDSAEHRGSEILYKQATTFYNNYKFNNNNLFELYTSMERLEDRAHVTLMHDQRARGWLAFLIKTIVLYDYENTSLEDISQQKFSHFNRIFTLLNSANKPFIVWKICRHIPFRPEIIPYLLIESNLCTLALCIIDNLEPYQDKSIFSHEVWVKAVDLLLYSLPYFDGNETMYAEIIFQLYRQLNDNKYNIPFNRTNNNAEQEGKQQHEKKENGVLRLMEDKSIVNGNFYGASAPLILSKIFELLTSKFLNLEIPSLYNNGTIQFPMLKWDALFWLIKITTHLKYREQFTRQPEKLNNLTDAFLSQYLENLEQNEVHTYDYFEEKEVQKVPLWSEKIERLELLEWIYPIYALNARGKLSLFISPRIEFESTSEYYHERNRFKAEKLRTHIGVLLQILRQLVLPTIPYGFKKEKLHDIKSKIEVQVIDYVNQYSQDVPNQGRVDLFSYHFDAAFKQSEKDALLPQLARAINWFDNKNGIIDAILSANHISKILTLLDYVTSEGIKKTLIDKIQKTDLIDFLDNQNWIPEIQTTLVKLSRYPELLSKTEQAVEYWKKRVIKRRNEIEYKAVLYNSQLLVSYFKNDITGLNANESPGAFHGSINELSYDGQKDFYRGLFFIKDEPKKGFEIFDLLTKRYSSYISFALNRMVAKLNWGHNSKNTDLFHEAYEEWEQVKKNFSQSDIDSLEPDIASCLITILNELDDFEKADEIFSQLDLPERMTSSVLSARIDCLVKQKRTSEAFYLIESAKTYHQFAEETAIAFIEELELKVSGEDNVSELSIWYNRIFKSQLPKLIKILSPAFNGKQELYEFLVKEIINAADKMLEKIKSIAEIKNEDKYNDLIELVLDARLNGLGVNAGAQNRGAYSGRQNDVDVTQPGERDIPIFDSNKKALLICEALIYRGVSNVVSHLQKVFNYHHQREAFAIMLYDTGTIKKSFSENWNDYQNDILPNIRYPETKEITEKFVDVTADFDCNESAIKVGKSFHGTTVIFHVFVNINYHLKVVKILS